MKIDKRAFRIQPSILDSLKKTHFHIGNCRGQNYINFIVIHSRIVVKMRSKYYLDIGLISHFGIQTSNSGVDILLKKL